MKRKSLLLVTSCLALSLSLGGLVFSLSSNVKEAKAYSFVKPKDLPTTLDLSDSTASTIRSYYSSLSSLDNSERQGDNLLKNLKTILSKDQTYYSYDDESGRNNSIWCLYEIIDRDWSKSPATDIVDSSKSTYISGATYNSSTKTLTGYSYGTTDPSIHALYYDREYPNYMTAWYNHTPRTKEFVLEREHIWPKSHGFDKSDLSTTGGARGDPMHLWAAEGYSNGIHSNNYYGYVDTTKTYTNCGDYSLTTYTVYSTTEYAHHNYSGTSLSLGSGTVFEPQDCDKGDIARAVFYMAARYNNIAGLTSGIDSNEPNLYLSDVIDMTSGESTATKAYNLGLLHDLLEWHHNDPVDEFEIHRNNLLFNNYTNNRNPFIDFPEWADYIWGTPEANMTYSSPTGYAQPSSDTINGYNSGTTPETESDVITISTTGVTSSSYTDFSNKTVTTSDAVYAGQCIKSNNGIAIRNTSPSGIVQTTSGGKVSSISVAWNSSSTNGKTIDVYGKSTSYSSGSDLYDSSKRGTKIGSIVCGTSTSLTISDDYSYIGIKSNSGTVYLDSITINYSGPEATSITAASTKTYHPGDVISKSDIVVTDNYGNAVSDYTFAENNYQFDYEDAPSGGAVATKSFDISYNNLETTLVVSVCRTPYQAPTDDTRTLSTANGDFAGISDSSETNTITKDGISYVATESYKYSNMLSFKTYKNSETKKYYTNSVFYNDTVFPTSIKSVSYELGGSLIVNIDPVIEFSNDKSNWSSTNNGNYHHFRIRYDGEFTGYVNFSSITITLYGAPTAYNVANYIMYEDTNNQCLTKLDIAIGYFNDMSKTERNNFMASSDFVLTSARLRLQDWARHEGRTITYVDGDYAVSSNNIATITKAKNLSIAIILISFASVTMLGGILIIKKRTV